MTEQPITLIVVSPPQLDAIDRIIRRNAWLQQWNTLVAMLGADTMHRICDGGPIFRTEIGGCDVGGIWCLPFGAEKEEQRLR